MGHMEVTAPLNEADQALCSISVGWSTYGEADH